MVGGSVMELFLVKIITISMMVFSFYIHPSFVSYREKSGLDIKTGIFILPPRGMGEPFTLNGHTTIHCSSPVSFSRFIIHTALISISSLKLPS
jgi:hypothetical protein